MVHIGAGCGQCTAAALSDPYLGNPRVYRAKYVGLHEFCLTSLQYMNTAVRAQSEVKERRYG